MYIDLPTNENVTEASRVYKEQYSKQFSNETANREKLQPTPLVPLVREYTHKTIVLPTTKRSSVTFVREADIWPPIATEAPEATKAYSPLYNGILGGVLVVVIVWVAVIIIILRNKLLARKQRRRERLPPPYLSMQSNIDSNSLRTETNPQFGLPEQSESSIIDIGTNIEFSPLFVTHQPTAPNAAATSQSHTDEQPPCYAEIHPDINGIKSSFEEQPPSYLEAQQQRLKSWQNAVSHLKPRTEEGTANIEFAQN